LVGGGTIWGMAKHENHSSSTNGSSPDVFIDDEDRRQVQAQHARFREVRKELEAQGVDGTAEYEKLLAKAATWSSSPA
jgi:hypothetical protein